MKFGIRNKKPKDENIHNKIPEDNNEYFTIPPSRTTNDEEKPFTKNKIPTDAGTRDENDKKEAFKNILPPRIDEKIPQDTEPPSRYGNIPKEKNKDKTHGFQLPPKLQTKKPDSKPQKERPSNYGIIEDKKDRKKGFSNKSLPKTSKSKEPETHEEKRLPASYGFNDNKKDNKDNPNKIIPKTILSKHPESPPTNKGTNGDKKNYKGIHNKVLPRKIKSKHPSKALPPSSNLFNNKSEKKSNKLVPKSIFSKRPKAYPTNKGIVKFKADKKNILSKKVPRSIISKKPDKRSSPPPLFENSIPKTKIHEKKPNN